VGAVCWIHSRVRSALTKRVSPSGRSFGAYAGAGARLVGTGGGGASAYAGGSERCGTVLGRRACDAAAKVEREGERGMATDMAACAEMQVGMKDGRMGG
jgi:hypothetical protein